MSAKILLVDDEAAIADLVEVYLSNEGYTVYKCENAAQALECVAEKPVDLAILDVMLPDLSGFELCRRIRKKHLWPILMLTARVEGLDKIQGLMLGADDYITKPFNPLELLARVKTQLRRYTQYNQSAQPEKSGEYEFNGLCISEVTHKCTLYGRSWPSRRWNSRSCGICAATGGRWCPASSCSRRCGVKSTSMATTP